MPYLLTGLNALLKGRPLSPKSRPRPSPNRFQNPCRWHNSGWNKSAISQPTLARSASIPAGPAREKHNALQLLVVEEVVEAPQAPVFAERIRAQVRVVGVDGATFQRNFVVHCGPQSGSEGLVQVANGGG